jgi:hypothetical protein
VHLIAPAAFEAKVRGRRQIRVARVASLRLRSVRSVSPWLRGKIATVASCRVHRGGALGVTLLC